jgi:hypothetical protein
MEQDPAIPRHAAQRTSTLRSSDSRARISESFVLNKRALMPAIRSFGKSEKLGPPLEVVALEEHKAQKHLVGCGTEEKACSTACSMA